VKLRDSVEPEGMAPVIAAAGAPPVLTGVATAVDPELVLPYLSNRDDLADVGLAAAPTDQRTVADVFARQLEYPTVIALVEDASCGAGAEYADDSDHALLAQLAPGARAVRAEDGGLGAALLGQTGDPFAPYGGGVDMSETAGGPRKPPLAFAVRGSGHTAATGRVRDRPRHTSFIPVGPI
jgi:hypothetical protein